MERCWFIIWMLVACPLNSVLPLYRDKNSTNDDAIKNRHNVPIVSIETHKEEDARETANHNESSNESDHSNDQGTGDTDAVQALLARYLQRRLQGAQLSTPPPPSVFFNLNHQARVRSTSQMKFNSDLLQAREERRDRIEDYDDYEDDLQGFEDSERGRTRINLFSGN